MCNDSNWSSAFQIQSLPCFVLSFISRDPDESFEVGLCHTKNIFRPSTVPSIPTKPGSYFQQMSRVRITRQMWREGKKAADRKGLQKTLFASFKRRFWMKPCSEPVALRICMKLCLQRVPLGIWPAGVREYSVRLPNAQPPKLTNFRKNSKRFWLSFMI